MVKTVKKWLPVGRICRLVQTRESTVRSVNSKKNIWFTWKDEKATALNKHFVHFTAHKFH